MSTLASDQVRLKIFFFSNLNIPDCFLSEQGTGEDVTDHQKGRQPRPARLEQNSTPASAAQKQQYRTKYRKRQLHWQGRTVAVFHVCLCPVLVLPWWPQGCWGYWRHFGISYLLHVQVGCRRFLLKMKLDFEKERTNHVSFCPLHQQLECPQAVKQPTMHVQLCNCKMNTHEIPSGNERVQHVQVQHVCTHSEKKFQWCS